MIVNISPLITERSMKDAESNKFSFRVSRFANKRNIKKTIEDRFLVNIIAISTTVVKGKTFKTGPRRFENTRTPWKKAIVKLKEGQKIGIFDSSEK